MGQKEETVRHTGFEKLSFWEKLTEEQKERLSSHVREAVYQEGQIVRAADSECAGILLVKQGIFRHGSLRGGWQGSDGIPAEKGGCLRAVSLLHDLSHHL